MHTESTSSRITSQGVARDRTQEGEIPPRWPLERLLFVLAGTLTLISALLAAVVSPWFLLLTSFVGLNQWLYVIFGACPASLILERAGVARRCHWN